MNKWTINENSKIAYNHWGGIWHAYKTIFHPKFPRFDPTFYCLENYTSGSQMSECKLMRQVMTLNGFSPAPKPELLTTTLLEAREQRHTALSAERLLNVRDSKK